MDSGMKENHLLARSPFTGASPLNRAFAVLFAAGVLLTSRADAQNASAVAFNSNFESGSLGKVECVSDSHFICHVRGEYDQNGRNRQASWYYFRMDHVRDRDITLELADLVGEYNGRPGTHPVTKDTRPVYSYDGVNWQHFEKMDWDEQKVRGILRFRPERDRVWIAHIEPYTTADLYSLLESVRSCPHLRTEVIGKSAGGRDLLLLTVTNFEVPDDGKKVVWLMARQHAWETGGSFAAEGAIRFAASAEAQARELRDRIVFKFTPMVDPDGVARGGVRFNANGYDLNRHWQKHDLRNPQLLKLMPEIWYFKKAIVHCSRAEKPVDLLVYLHNTEYSSFIDDAPPGHAQGCEIVARFYDLLLRETEFDAAHPPRPPTLGVNMVPGVLTVLMELKVMKSKRLGRYPTGADRIEFGRGLARCMALAVLDEEDGVVK